MAKEKIVTQSNLQYYDTKLKAWVNAQDTITLDAAKAYTDGKADNYDPAGTAQTKVDELKNGAVKDNTDAIAKLNGDSTVDGSVDKKIATAKTALDASIAAVEQKADKNASDISTLDGKVGTIPTSSGVDNVIAYVDKKTSGIATDGAVTALADRVTSAEGEIDVIQADYLKAADKTELEGKITAEETARKAAVNALDDRLAVTEAFFVTAEGETLDAALDTLKEIQDYIKTEGSEADQMVLNIANNAKAIEDEKTRAEAAETALDGRLDVLEAIDHDAYKAADNALSARITTLEGAVGESGSVAEDIAAAKSEAIDTAAADATTKANNALSSAKSYTDTEVGKDRTRLTALEADTHTHANKTLLDTYTQTEANLADAVAKKHSHANATVLDGITVSKVSAWDTAESNAKTYADGLNSTLSTTVTGIGDRTTALEALVGDGYEPIENASIDAMFATE